MINFKHICSILAAVRCLNAGQTVAQVAASAKVSTQTIYGWLKEAGFRKMTINGKDQYVNG